MVEGRDLPDSALGSWASAAHAPRGGLRRLPFGTGLPPSSSRLAARR